MTKTTRVNVVLPDTQLKRLEHVALREKRSLSSVIREAIEEYTGIADTVQLGKPKQEAPAATGER